jgi:hypothetical protein
VGATTMLLGQYQLNRTWKTSEHEWTLIQKLGSRSVTSPII